MSLRFLTSGESHGRGLMGILEGLPSGLKISESELMEQMRRRKLGYGRGARQKIEDDAVEILSGVRHGKSLGSPVGLLIWNKDWPSWQEVMKVAPPTRQEVGSLRARAKTVRVPRPGHADLIGGVKYDHSDLRNVLERASARETAMRVALGSFARFFLKELGVSIASRVVQIGSIEDHSIVRGELSALNSRIDRSPVRCFSKHAEKKMIAEVAQAAKNGDTLGGVFEVIAAGHPIALGSYAQWDRRLEGALAQALMSLNAIKGVEVGMGFGFARVPGSKAHDTYLPSSSKSEKREARLGLLRFSSNRSGGIEGGMTTGEPLIIRAAMKPLSTLMNALPSIDLDTGKAVRAHIERSDVCAVPSAAVIGESLVALVLADAILEKFGGDSMREIGARVQDWNRISRG